MKKIIVALAAVLAAGALAGGVGATADAGKVIASGFSCGIVDGTGAIITTENSVLTLYQHRSVLQCWGNGAPAASLTYWNYENTGYECGMLDFGSTLNWVDKVGTKGNSQLTCYGPTSPASASGGAGLG